MKVVVCIGSSCHLKGLQDNEMSARFQYTAHFGEPSVEIFEVADTEGNGNSVKVIIGKRE